jgi:hypothetical protein
VVELLKEWDEDGNGEIEVAKLVCVLGFDALESEVQQVFDGTCKARGRRRPRLNRLRRCRWSGGGGGWRGRRAESEGLLPLSTPAVATERCATEVPVTAPWGSPFGEVPPAGSRSGERMVPATAPSAVPGSRPCRLTSRKSAGSDEPVA